MCEPPSQVAARRRFCVWLPGAWGFTRGGQQPLRAFMGCLQLRLIRAWPCLCPPLLLGPSCVVPGTTYSKGAPTACIAAAPSPCLPAARTEKLVGFDRLQPSAFGGVWCPVPQVAPRQPLHNSPGNTLQTHSCTSSPPKPYVSELGQRAYRSDLAHPARLPRSCGADVHLTWLL